MAWACITWSCAVILASRAATSFSSLSAALVGDSGRIICHAPLIFSPANSPAFNLLLIVSGETSNCALAWRMLRLAFCKVRTSSLSVAYASLGKLLGACPSWVMQSLGGLLILHRARLGHIPVKNSHDGQAPSNLPQCQVVSASPGPVLPW